MAEYKSRHTGGAIDDAVDKAKRLPSDLGSAGQVLKSTGTGMEWGDASTGSSSDYVTPEQYGAAADGVTDDTAALQAAVNAAAAHKKALVLAPNTYRITKTITLPSEGTENGFQMRGFDANHTCIKADGGFVAFYADRFKRSVIEKLKIEFPSSCPAGAVGIRIGSTAESGLVCYMSAIHDVVVNYGSGIEVLTSAYMSVYDCAVYFGANQFGIAVSGEYFYANNCYLSGELETAGNTAKTGRALWLKSTNQTYIEKCDCCNTRGYGIYFDGDYQQINTYIDKTTLFNDFISIYLNINKTIETVIVSNCDLWASSQMGAGILFDTVAGTADAQFIMDARFEIGVRSPDKYATELIDLSDTLSSVNGVEYVLPNISAVVHTPTPAITVEYDERLNVKVNPTPQDDKGADDYVTPEAYGAKGDGVTDDTAAVQSAIEMAARKGLPVKLSKKYMVNISQITTPVTIVGTFPVWTNVSAHVGTQPGITPNIVSDSPITIDAAVTFIGVGFGADLVLKHQRIHFFKCVYYGRSDALTFVNDSGEWRGEVTIRQCAFSNCARCIVSEASARNYTDVEISECAAIYGGTFMYGRFSGWMVTSNHIYSGVAFDGDCSNSIFANNYIDGEGTMIRMGVRGSVLFSGNMFYGGAYPAGYDGNSKIATCEFERVYGTGNNIHVSMHGNTVNYPESCQANRVFVKTLNECFVTMTETRIKGGTLFESDSVYHARYINVDHIQSSLVYGSKSYIVDIVHNVAEVSVALPYDGSITQAQRVFTTPWGAPGPAVVLAPMVYTNTLGEQTIANIWVHFISNRFDLIGIPVDYASDGTIYITAALPMTYRTDSI